MIESIRVLRNPWPVEKMNMDVNRSARVPVAPGAFDFLKGRGGWRAEILSEGILRSING